MKTYKCKVRCKGDVRDEVRKKDVTSGEIRLLQQIHGDDAVSEITETGTVDRSQAAERSRLEMAYGAKRVAVLFGHVTHSLADEIVTEKAAEPVVETPAQEIPIVERTAKPDDNAKLFS